MAAPIPGFHQKEHTRSFSGGDVIFTAGDPGGSIFLVLQGRVRVEKAVEGSKLTIGVLEPGEFFGEISFHTHEEMQRSISATALTDCSLLELDTASFEESLADEPELALSLLRSFSRRLRKANRRTVELIAGERMMRLIDYLLDVVIQEADIAEEGLVVETPGDPLDHLAERCLLEREEVEELAAILRDRGIIELPERRLVLKGFTALKRLRTYLQLRSEFGSFL